MTEQPKVEHEILAYEYDKNGDMTIELLVTLVLRTDKLPSSMNVDISGLKF